MKVKERKIIELIPAEYNPRYISDEAFEQLKASIQRFDAVEPVLVNTHTDRKNIIISGHQRIKAAKALGMDTFPCVELSLDRDKERELNIRMNKNTGDWDWDDLAAYFDVEELTDWGFTDEDLFGDGGFDEPEAQEDNFEVPDEDEIETDIQEGDLIEIGRHRLLCGDSTDADSVQKLLGGAKPMLMVTDPPYGVSVDHSWRDDVKNRTPSPRGGQIKNDDRADWEETYKNFDTQIAYVWHGALFADIVKGNLENAGYDVRQQIIWVKSVHSLSRSAYHWKHEPCWYAVRKGENGNWKGDRKQMTVWDADSPIMSTSHNEDATSHPTQKPIIVASKPIKNHTTEKDIIADPFLGSGTTMVAAHQLGRTCYGMELDPKYCQVIVDRMLKLDPSLEVKINGDSYESV